MYDLDVHMSGFELTLCYIHELMQIDEFNDSGIVILYKVYNIWFDSYS